MHEPILFGWREGAAHYFVDDRTQTTILEYDRPQASELHPTMKPIPLVTKLIQNSSRRGELVLDLFGGSGSTLIACEKTNRKVAKWNSTRNIATLSAGAGLSGRRKTGAKSERAGSNNCNI
jgi:hypothetical protein